MSVHAGARWTCLGLLLAVLLLLVASTESEADVPDGQASPDQTRTAVFGGGCFWCMQPPYDGLEGVISTTVGFAGGNVANPSYRQVMAGGTGHVEVVKVRYDPQRISYQQLLEVFWRNIDPLAVNRQFCDIGDMYRSAIFVADQQQRELADASLQQLAASGRFEQPIATEILAIDAFYRAEDYHQDYYRKNPLRYRYYRRGCGRDQRLQELWGE